MTNEYQEVAAIVCMDIDILASIAENKNHDAEFLRNCIKNIKQKKDDIINDSTKRSMRYNSMNNIFSVVVNNK